MQYTVYLKFKKCDIPNTQISAEIYRIPDLKSACILYTQIPWPTLIKIKDCACVIMIELITYMQCLRLNFWIMYLMGGLDRDIGR